MMLFNKIFSFLLILSFFLSGCAAIPARKIKIDNYSKINQIEKDRLSLNYKTFKFEPDKKGYVFDSSILRKLNNNVKSDDQSSCSARVSTMHSAPFPRVCIVNYVTSFFTLFTLPYYCQHTYEVQSALISYPSKKSLEGKSINIFPDQINFSDQTQVKQSKRGNYLLTKDDKKVHEGDYFLDEDGRVAKLLKTYELKDKVHEIWSSLWMLSWFVVNPTKYAPNAEYPKDAKRIVENNVSEALVRSVLNDASKFEECKE